MQILDIHGIGTGPHLDFKFLVDDEPSDPTKKYTPDQLEGAEPDEFAGGAPGGSSGNSNQQRQYGENQFQGTVKIRRVAPDKQLGSADQSVATGNTTAIGGEDITKIGDETLKEKYIKTWQQGTTVYLNAETRLYTYKNRDPDKEDLKIPRTIKENGQDVLVLKGAEATYTGNYKVQQQYFSVQKEKIYVEIQYEGKTGYVPASTIDIKRSVNLVPTNPSAADEVDDENNSNNDNNQNSQNNNNENKGILDSIKDFLHISKATEPSVDEANKETTSVAKTSTEFYSANIEHALAGLDGVLMIGDSITKAMQDYKSGGDSNCTYKANDGWTAQKWLDNFSELQGVDGVKAINIMLGANDCLDNPEGSLASLKQLVEKLHGEYKDAVIYVDKCLPMNGGGQDAWNTYNSNIGSMGLDYVIAVDVSENVEYEQDGVHPTQNGSKTLFGNIQKQIEANGMGDSSDDDSIFNGFKWKSFKVALSVGGSEGNEEEVITSSKIVEKTKELIEEDYKNVKIELTGNSYDKKSKKTTIISEEERKQNARESGAAAAVEVRLNPETGVDSIYRENDGYSMELAGYLADYVTTELGTENKQAGSDVEKLGSESPALNNYANTRTASSIVRTEGGLVQNNEGIEKCARGIEEAIIKYLKSDHANARASVIREETKTDSIKSKIISLTYVPYDEFEKIKTSAKGNNIASEPFNKFTLDQDGNIITTSWNYSGSMQVKQNSPINIKTTFAKYSTPYEYMLIFYILMDHRGFTNDLADEIINNSEFVITLQDNVSTRQVNNAKGTDTVTTALDVTYARTWFVEIFKESSFSSVALQLQDMEQVSTPVKGVATYTEAQDENGNITKTLDCKYDLGEGVTRDRLDIFARLFQDNDLNARLQPMWLVDFVEAEEAAAKMGDLTRYMIYAITNMYLGIDFIEFSEIYKLDHFDNVSYMIGGLGGFIQGSTLQETVWFTLISQGLTEFQAAGIMGNISQECDWNNAATDGGLGFFQLIDDRAERLKQFAASKGKDWTDVGIQLEYVVGELTPGGGANGFAVFNMYEPYRTTWENATSPESAAEAFCYGFERPGIPVIERRTSEARRFYEEFHGRQPPTTSFTGSGQFFDPQKGYIYRQVGDPFGGVDYRSDGKKFADFGCGPCAAAMVISDLTGKQVLPTDIWDPNNYAYAMDNGCSDAYFEPIGRSNNLDAHQVEMNTQACIDCLSRGGEVISIQVGSGGGPLCGSGGHFIVVYGYDRATGQCKIKQSGIGERYSAHEDETFDAATVCGVWARNNWTYNRPGT